MRQVKLRFLGGTKESHAYGITVPTEIAEKYQDSYFYVTEQDGCIMLVSGTRLQRD